MTDDNSFVDLEPTPAQDNTPAAQNSNTSARQIAERQSDIAVLSEALPDLRLNLLTNKMEYGSRTSPTVLNGDDLDILTCKLAVQKNVFIPEARIKAAVRFAAKENAYCPIKRYLMECNFSAEPYPEWDRLGEVLLGSKLPIATRAMQRFFIGAVARAYTPGISMSWIPIFIGKQGCGKSQLLHELVPEELFAEMTVTLDILMKEIYRLHISWLIELPEVDNYFSVRNIENFKNLITTRVDETRLPYQSLPVSLSRRFVMAGTSNRSEFLVDPTGNRRFIPLEIADNFETPWRELPSFRDQIWKRALMEFEKGTSWEITTGELAEISDYISSFAEVDPWDSIVADFTANKSETTTTDVLVKGLGFTAQGLTKRDSRRAASILTSLGWRRQVTSRKDSETGKSRSVRIWKRPKGEKSKSPKTLTDF